MTRALCLLFALASTTSALADPATDVKDAVNRIRAVAGLHDVEVDPALGAGCMKHTEYLRLNEGSSAIAGLRAHHEQSDLPGASPEGAACGEAADLAFDQPDVASAVSRGWLAGIYHRRPMLDATVDKIGVGYSKQANGHYIVALRFVTTDAKNGTWPVRYPADHQNDVPLDLLGEIPRPVPHMPAGFPITLQFPPFDKVTDVSAAITDDKGQAVAAYVSDPEHPATTFPQLGIVSLIAKHPLAPATTYRVAIDATWRGKRERWTWQFKTLALRAVDARDLGAVQAALDVPSLVRGRVSHAGTLDHGRTVWLQLGKSDPSISIMMPVAVWRKLAGDVDPRTWERRTVEVQATPARVGSKFINLPISAADQVTP